jgi:glycosyltransferase involved in cell wall biosynthesis
VDQVLSPARALRRSGKPYRVSFVLSTVAGNTTRIQNMQRWADIDPDVETRWHPVQPWIDGDWLGRILPMGLRVRARTFLEGWPVFGDRDKDAVVFHAAEPYEIFSWVSWLTRGRSVIVANEDDPRDWGDEALYVGYGRKRPAGLGGRIRHLRQRVTFARTDLFVPWTTWARDCLIRYSKIDPARIEVLHPGIDLGRWRAVDRSARDAEKVRILFVGWDFYRKGGQLLLDVFRESFAGRCELHLVTGWAPPELVTAEADGLYVHRSVRPGSAEQLALYEQADIFALPSTADFSPWAFLEAAASCLPMIGTRIGGIPDVVQDGNTGFLVEPGDREALRRRLSTLVDDSAARLRMGQQARALVEERFDVEQNMRTLLALVKERVDQRRKAPALGR